MSNDDDKCNENNATENKSDDNQQQSVELKHNTDGKKAVHFTSPVEQVFYFNGVTEEERDDYWFRRTDYIEFVENELRRRELLNQIEFSSGNPEDARKTQKQQRRASTGPDTGTSHNTAEDDPTKSATETAMKHTFTRRMVGRTFSSGPPRRRRLPRRERNELDVCQHQSQLAKVKNAAEAAAQQQQTSSSSSSASKTVESHEEKASTDTIASTEKEQQLQPATNSENTATPASSPPLATTATTTATDTSENISNATEKSGPSTLNVASASTIEKNQSGSEDGVAQNASSKSKTAEPTAMSGDNEHDDDHDKNEPTPAMAIEPGPSPTQALAV